MALLIPWDDLDLFPALRDKVNNIVTAVNALSGGAKGSVFIKNSANDFDFGSKPAITMWENQFTWNMSTTALINGNMPIAGSLDTKQEFLNNIIGCDVRIFKTAITNSSFEFLNSSNTSSPPVVNGTIPLVAVNPSTNSIDFQVWRSAGGVFNAPAYAGAVCSVRFFKIGN